MSFSFKTSVATFTLLVASVLLLLSPSNSHIIIFKHTLYSHSFPSCPFSFCLDHYAFITIRSLFETFLIQLNGTFRNHKNSSFDCSESGCITCKISIVVLSPGCYILLSLSIGCKALENRNILVRAGNYPGQNEHTVCEHLICYFSQNTRKIRRVNNPL